MKKSSVLLLSILLTLTSFSQTILSEGFDIWPPESWQFYLLGDAVDGWRDDFNGLSFEGTGSAYSSIDNAQCDNWMVTPSITVLNSEYQLSFWEIHDSPEFYDNASVLVSAGSGDPSEGDFIEVFEANILNTSDWEERIVDLSSFAGQSIYVAFRYEGTYHAWNVDEVNISPSNFKDGALTAVMNPAGVSPTQSQENVIVRLENTGVEPINNFTIEWDINDEAQDDFNVSDLGLASGQFVDLDLGDFEFSVEGTYSISATLVLLDDFDSSNNQASGSYDISPLQDGSVTEISPEGIIPISGSLPVKVTIVNEGSNTINTAEIEWSVNSIEQVSFTSNSLNLAPEESLEIVVGTFDFLPGENTISATLNALGDDNESNDSYSSQSAMEVFIESFEGVQFPPEEWSIEFGVRDDINFDLPVDGNYYYNTFVDNNFFGEVNDTLYSPVLHIEEGDHFRFYIKTSPASPVDHTLIWKDADTGETGFIANIPNSPGLNNWALRDLDITSAAGNRRIGIVSSNLGGFGSSSFDYFESDASLYQRENDLRILRGDMDFLAYQSTETSFSCKIRNSGSNLVSGTDYTLKLMEAPDMELASVAGVDLLSWEDAIIELSYNFSELGNRRLYFEIEYLDDEYPADNTFREAQVSIVPPTSALNPIGSPDVINANIPFTANGSTQSLGEDDLSQMLFLSEEIQFPGYTYGLAYKYDNLLQADRIIEYPMQVWLAQTPVNDLSSGWLPNEDLVLVYDGVVEILPGFDRDLYIPFDEPVLINGLENIVIKTYHYDPEWPPSICRFYSNDLTSGVTRSIGVADVFNLDPLDPPVSFFAFPSFTYTRFVIDPIAENGELSGFVRNEEDDTPIENATVAIEGSNISSSTDALGAYAFPPLPYGSYELVTTAEGFTTESATIELDSVIQTQNFLLDPLPEIQLQGIVFGSNDTSTPLESVEVAIFQEGTFMASTSTDSNGAFLFPSLFGSTDYDVALSMYGYFSSSIEVSTSGETVDLGPIILQEEFISPFDVVASTDDGTELSWKTPKLSAKEKLQRDLGIVSFSYTNEPNENVWLGNIFEINEITTLTSVEIQTDVYENAIDFVTVEIIDATSNEVIASSEPFLIQQDSIQTIDIPNIVLTADFVAAIHWQNNAASTNSLAVDFSDPEIDNAAVIKYPNEDYVSLSDFFGGESPNLAFHVRVNTLDDATPITNGESVTYNILRGLASEFPNTQNWISLNSNPFAGLSTTDGNTDGIDPLETYRYAVEAIYQEGESEVTFSNEILGSNILSSDELLPQNISLPLYPNPTSDFITLAIDETMAAGVAIIIYDAMGKAVLHFAVPATQESSMTIDVSSLSNGTYFCTIEGYEPFGRMAFVKK